MLAAVLAPRSFTTTTTTTSGASSEESDVRGQPSRASTQVVAGEPPHRPGDGTVEENRLGRYRLLRLVGQGGMGVVYVAYNEMLDRRVAIKRVRAGGSDDHARILHEAKALAQLSHPNVVQIFEASASAGRIFIAMEYSRAAPCAPGRRAGAPGGRSVSCCLWRTSIRTASSTGVRRVRHPLNANRSQAAWFVPLLSF